MQFERLAGIPIFAGLSGDERWELARAITARDVPAREVLFWVGDLGAEFFIVDSGQIDICVPDQSGREMTLAVLGPGAFFGEIALLDGGPRTATARARSDVTVLCLGRDEFLHFIRRFPSAAIHMMTVLGQRNRESVDKLRGIRNLNEVMEQKLTAWERIATTFAAMAASRGFLLAHALAFGSWIAVNLHLGRGRAPDPFPFSFLCFWTSCEAIFLSLFILISQNMQGQKDRIRTEMEYQTALKTQFEIMQLHRKLDEIPNTVRQVLADGVTDDGPEQPLHIAT